MTDVIVAGGGIIGLLSALELSGDGASVVLIDPGSSRPPASWAGGGILSPLFPWRYGEAVTQLAAPALSLYQALSRRIIEAGGPDPEVRDCGLRVLSPQDREQALLWCREHGIQAKADEGDLWLPGIGTVRNPRLLKGLWRLVQASPDISVVKSAVTALSPAGDGGWRVVTGLGEHRSHRVLVAAGAWSQTLLAPLGVDLPLMPVKGEMLLYAPGPEAPESVILSEHGYVIPRADGCMLVGSTVAEGDWSTLPSREAGMTLWRRAGDIWAPLGGARPAGQWAGIRPGSRREAPFIGAVPAHEGLFVATGHFRNGLVCAPATARLITALIQARTPELDPASYSLSSC